MTRSLALVLLAALAGCDDPEAPDGGLPPDAPAPPACTWTPPAEPEDIADLILFLCSDAARYLTGAEFTADGGYTAA